MSKDGTFNYHPIQLFDIEILHLSFEKGGLEAESSVDDGDPDKGHFKFFHAHSNYNEEHKTFAVKVKATVDNSASEDEVPYTINVEILGGFRVDDESFPLESIPSFAERNAPLVLYPYLREQVFGLASRAGIEQPILPLFEVPPFQLERK